MVCCQTQLQPKFQLSWAGWILNSSTHPPDTSLNLTLIPNKHIYSIISNQLIVLIHIQPNWSFSRQHSLTLALLSLALAQLKLISIILMNFHWDDGFQSQWWTLMGVVKLESDQWFDQTGEIQPQWLIFITVMSFHLFWDLIRLMRFHRIGWSLSNWSIFRAVTRFHQIDRVSFMNSHLIDAFSSLQ